MYPIVPCENREYCSSKEENHNEKVVPWHVSGLEKKVSAWRGVNRVQGSRALNGITYEKGGK